VDLTPSHAFLQAVAVLHRRGWESVRVFTELYEIGDWRCWLHASGWRSGRRPFRLGLYIGADDWEMPFPHDPSASMTPDEIADALELDLDARGREPDPEYGPWYAELIRQCSPNLLPLWRGGGVRPDVVPSAMSADGEIVVLDLPPEPPEPARSTGTRS